MITQASSGGIVYIGKGSSGDVSVVDSNLIDIVSTVRTLCEYPRIVLLCLGHLAPLCSWQPAVRAARHPHAL